MLCSLLLSDFFLSSCFSLFRLSFLRMRMVTCVFVNLRSVPSVVLSSNVEMKPSRNVSFDVPKQIYMVEYFFLFLGFVLGFTPLFFTFSLNCPCNECSISVMTTIHQVYKLWRARCTLRICISIWSEWRAKKSQITSTLCYYHS